MSKPANLSDEAYAALQAQKRSPKDSLSDVILRFVPRPIATFGDLERHLEDLEAPVIERIDYAALKRLRERKRQANRAD